MIAMLSLGVAVGMTTSLALQRRFEAAPAARTAPTAVSTPATTAASPAPPDAGVVAVTPDAAPLQVDGLDMPLGTMVEVGATNVWFSAPPGFLVKRIDDQAIQVMATDVSIVINVTTGKKLDAKKPPRESILAFAARSAYHVVSVKPHGDDRWLAIMTGTEDGKPAEITMLMHATPTRRVSTIVIASGARVGDPDVSRLTDEAFFRRLLYQ